MLASKASTVLGEVHSDFICAGQQLRMAGLRLGCLGSLPYGQLTRRLGINPLMRDLELARCASPAPYASANSIW
jgi:hypothetical protein